VFKRNQATNFIPTVSLDSERYYAEWNNKLSMIMVQIRSLCLPLIVLFGNQTTTQIHLGVFFLEFNHFSPDLL
jgi:hypothetical protein